MFSPIIRSQENDIFSFNKAIIETHIATERYYNYPEETIKILQSNPIPQR